MLFPGSYNIPHGLLAAVSARGQSKLHFTASFHLPLDKLDEILAAAQQTISASESPGPGGLASLGKHRPKGFFATEVGSLDGAGGGWRMGAEWRGGLGDAHSIFSLHNLPEPAVLDVRPGGAPPFLGPLFSPHSGNLLFSLPILFLILLLCLVPRFLTPRSHLLSISVPPQESQGRQNDVTTGEPWHWPST